MHGMPARETADLSIFGLFFKLRSVLGGVETEGSGKNRGKHQDKVIKPGGSRQDLLDKMRKTEKSELKTGNKGIKTDHAKDFLCSARKT
jgi:hypothetical protein